MPRPHREPQRAPTVGVCRVHGGARLDEHPRQLHPSFGLTPLVITPTAPLVITRTAPLVITPAASAALSALAAAAATAALPRRRRRRRRRLR